MLGTEVKVGEHAYMIGRLPAIKQFHVARRIAPLLAGLGEVAKDLAPADGDKDLSIDKVARLMEPIAEALGRMSDEDAETVIYTCLEAVRRQSGQGWAPVVQRGRQLMFQDIDLPEMMNLCIKVIAENLGGFFRDPAQPTGA